MDVRAGARGRGRDHVVAQGLDEILGGSVLRPGRGYDADQGRVAGGIGPWRRHRRDTRRVGECGPQPLDHLAVARGHLRHHDQRPVRPRAEAIGHPVVRLPARRALGVVARVGLAELHVEERRGDQAQHHEAEHSGDDPVPLHQPAPPQPAGRRLQVAVGGDGGGATPAQRNTEPVETPPQVAQQGREQGDGGDHDDQRGDHGDDGGAVHDGQAHHEQPQHAHHDRAAGHQDGPAGGVERRHRRSFGVEAHRPPFAEPGDHQQGIVDAERQTQHDADRGRELRHIEHRRGQTEQAETDAQRADRHGQRQPGRHYRAERDEQDQRGRKQADQLGRRLGRLGLLHRPAAEHDVQAAALGRRRGGQQLLRVLDRHVVGVDDIEENARGEGSAVRCDSAAGAVGGVGILDGRHVRQPAELNEQSPDLAPHLVAADVVGADHHFHRVAGLGREPLGQHGLCRLGIGAGRGGAVGELAAEGRGQSERDGERHGPSDQHRSAPPVGQAAESAQWPRPHCPGCDVGPGSLWQLSHGNDGGVAGPGASSGDRRQLLRSFA